MSYESWRISYQDSEQAARAAFAEAARLRATLAELEHENIEQEEQDFEVWQDGICVAGCSGPHYEAMREAAHYAAQYAADGPVEVFRVHRTRVDLHVRSNTQVQP